MDKNLIRGQKKKLLTENAMERKKAVAFGVKQKTSAAFNKAIGFVTASIDQVIGITKPQKKFLQWIFEKWVMLPVRHNFLNIFRYGDGQYSEKSIRHQFGRKVNFQAWFDSAFGSMKSKECVVAFDPSYIPKAVRRPMVKVSIGVGRTSRRNQDWRSAVWRW